MQPASTPDPEQPKLPTETLAQPLPVPGASTPTQEEKKIIIQNLKKPKNKIEVEPSSLPADVRPRAFVIMPFGKKKGPDGLEIDFNAIYSLLIKPALEAAGFEARRADEETKSGDILTDMFQELLLADLCLADLSIDNANVFYELGIRHAFRKRGIIHIQAGRAYMPFDVFNVRTIPYHITKEGVPDADFLEKDRAAIARVTRDTWASDIDAVHSPIFNLLDGLVEPDRRALKTPLAIGFWREYNEWKERISVAENQKRLGDILLLTEEIKNPLIKEEALEEVGEALDGMGLHELALTQYRKGLEVNAMNRMFRRKEAFNLNRLGKGGEAIIKIEGLLEEMPQDTEAVALLGRIYKEMWLESWNWIEEKDLRLRTAFESYHWLLKSFQTYLRGYRMDLDECYPGINAYTLGRILVHLADQFEDKTNPDPEIQAVREMLSDLQGALAFALETKTDVEQPSYWDLISLGELLLLTSETTYRVSRAYHKALTASSRNPFSIQSSLSQLKMLRSLEIRLEFVQAAIDVMNGELRRIRKEKTAKEDKTKKRKPAQEKSVPEGRVLLFTGYASRKGKMTPQEEQEITEAIDAVLTKYKAGPNTLAVTTGMDAGSELIFVERCVKRRIPVQVYLPLSEGPYVRDFVSSMGGQWTERFYQMRNEPLVTEFYQPECIGMLKESNNLKETYNVHERNNRWALYSALVRGIDKVRLIALSDGRRELPTDEDARLYKHMVSLMRNMGGVIDYIKPVKQEELDSSPSLPATPVPVEILKEKAVSNGHGPKKAAERRRSK